MMLRGERIDGDGPSIGETLLEPREFQSEPSEWDEFDVAVDRFAAHTYSECARIWNPIHTDSAYATEHGLPGIILHGTATAARALTVVVDHLLKGEPGRVTAMSCRFTSMVLMPNVLKVRVAPIDGSTIHATVTTSSGETALSTMRIEHT